MKRFLALTLILTVAMIGYAWATHTDSANQNVVVTVAPVFEIGFPGSPLGDGPNVTFDVTEYYILGGYAMEATSTAYLHAHSNYNETDVSVARTVFDGAADGDGEFTLYLDWSGGWQLIPDDGDTSLALWSADDGLDVTLLPHYELDGISVADDPDTYTSVVTYTMEAP